MNVVRIKNGIGNQMFEYAFYKKQKLMEKGVLVDLSWFEQPEADRPFVLKDAFPDIELDSEGAEEEIERMEAKIQKRPIWLKAFQYVFRNTRTRITDGHGQIYNPAYLRMENRFFDGFWQSEKYWFAEREIIRDCFQFREIKNERLQHIESICKGENTVSLHVRRTDYLAAHRNGRFTGICTEEYYKKAIDYIWGRFPDAKFIIFSDDIQWVKENWHRESWIYAEDYLDADLPDWVNMKLMSMCQHNIIANSTFSWWGAYLNRNPNKIVISPKKWLNGIKTPDILPQGWIGM